MAGVALGALALAVGAGAGVADGLWQIRDLAGRAPARAAFAPLACTAALALATSRARGLPSALALELHALDLALQGGSGLRDKFSWGSRRKDMLHAFTALALLQAIGAVAAMCLAVAAVGGTHRGTFDLAGVAFVVGSALYHVGIAALRWWAARLEGTVQRSDIYAVAEEGEGEEDEDEDEDEGVGEKGAGDGKGGGSSAFRRLYGALGTAYVVLGATLLGLSFASGSDAGDRALQDSRPPAQWACAIIGLVWEVAFALDLRRHLSSRGPPEVAVQPRTLF